jgi:hypothetical protein
MRWRKQRRKRRNPKIPRTGELPSAQHSTLAKQRRDVTSRLTTPVEQDAKNLTSVPFAGRIIRNLSSINGGNVVMVAGRLFQLRTNEGLVWVLISPKLLLGL